MLNRDFYKINKKKKTKFFMSRNLFSSLLQIHEEDEHEINEMMSQELSEDEEDGDEDDEDESTEWSSQIDELVERASKAGKNEEDAFGIYVHFTTKEFMELFGIVQDAILPSGRGKKPKLDPMTKFFLTLYFCRLYRTNISMAIDFGVKIGVVKDVPFKIMKKCIPVLKKELMKVFSQTKCRELGIEFQHFKEALLVGYCSVQARQRPGNSSQRKYYDGKHKCHTIKWYYSHYPSGYVCQKSKLYPGSKFDKTVLLDCVDETKELLVKTQMEMRLRDDGELHDQYPSHWAILYDKGFQGIVSELRAIIPKKKPRNGNLTSREKRKNSQIGEDRIICENFYGRKKVLWKATREKTRHSDKDMDLIDTFCTLLTNYDIIKRPLRNQEMGYTIEIICRKSRGRD
jgi:hypothetical protein